MTARLAGLTAVLVLVLCAAASAADPFWHTTYPSTEGFDLSDVSCMTATSCIAVGQSGEAVVQDGDYQYETRPESVPSFNAISCARATRFCMAVDNQGNAVPWSDGEFGAVDNFDGDVELQSVSCPSTTFCMAIDHDDVPWKYSGGAWSPLSLSKPANYSNFARVACASPTYCVAVTGASDATRYAIFNGTSFGSQTKVFGDAEAGNPKSLICTSPTFCLLTTSVGTADRWDGVNWNHKTVSGFQLWGSCAGTTCHAIDQNVKVYETTDGVNWSDGTSITSTGLSFPAAVDCVAADLCVAVSGTESGTFARGITPTTSSVLSGTGAVGQTLTVTHSAIDEARAFFVDQWFRCDNPGSTCVQIEDVKGTTYTLTDADAGKYVEARDITGVGLDEEGANLVKNRMFVSNSIHVDDGTAPGPSPSPSSEPSASPSPSPSPAPTGPPLTPGVHGKVKTSKTAASIPVSCTGLGTTCTGKLKLIVKKKTVGSARYSVAAGKTKRIKVKLSKAARKALKKRGKLKVTLTFTPADGSAIKQTLTLKRKH